MLAGYNIIYFAPEKWNGLWRNRQHLMSVFARKNRVLFVEPRLHFQPMMTDLWQGQIDLSDLYRSSVRQVAENLFIFRYPMWAPISGQFPLKQLNQTIRRLLLQRVLRKLNMSQPIVWFSRPTMIDLLNETPSPLLRIYHIVDEYTAYSGQTPERRQRLEWREKQMLGQVDMVIVVSESLYQARLPAHAQTYLVPNGVNYQAYTAALANETLPETLRIIKYPRLGYIGLIGDKLNLAMLKQLAQENPEWSLVLLGEARVTQQMEIWQALQALPNVHYLGAVDIQQVPDYVKGFQVGLMPYLQNRHSENISPLKLYDYLAAGIPIASVNFPAAREFSPYIHLADSPEDFAQAVRNALADTAPERCQARRAVAAEHTWERRVEQLSTLLQAQLDKKVSANGQVH